jgi:DNA-binding NarL/FixJ family response regulator
MNKLKILLVDDHQILREVISVMLKNESGYEIVAEASSVEEAEKVMEAHAIDIVILDIGMPNRNGLQLIETAKRKYPEVKFLILSMHLEDEYVFKAVDLGVKGYLHKDASSQELLMAIKHLANGESYFSQKVVKIIMEGTRYRRHSNGKKPKDLTRREKEIISLVIEGMSNAEIAEQLGISVRTVENHRFNMLRKIGARNTPELVKFTLENRILER